MLIFLFLLLTSIGYSEQQVATQDGDDIIIFEDEDEEEEDLEDPDDNVRS